MRILIYGPNYAPEKTGTGKYTAEMAEWFAGRGHDVEVITGPPHYPEWRLHDGYSNKHTVEQLSGVTVRRAPMYIPRAPITPLKRIRMESSFTIHAWAAWRRAIKNNPNLIIAVCPPMQVGFLAKRFANKAKIPWVFHVQDLQVDAAVRLGMLKPGLLTRALYRLEEKFLQKATRVSTITPGMQRRIEEKGVPAERIWQVPNWSDIEFVKPANRYNAWRAKHGFGAADIVCLYAGNMGKKQGLDIIIPTARYAAEDARIKFVLVGDGAVRPELEVQVDAAGLGNVWFLPLQEWDDVPAMLNAADIHLVIQKQEAADLVMPSKLTNILASGGCAVATVDPPATLHDVLAIAGCGVTTPADDGEALANAIRRLADSESRRLEYQKNARQYAEANLNREAILGRLEAQIEELIQGGRQ